MKPVRKPGDSNDEMELFAQAMRDVKRLKPPQVIERNHPASEIAPLKPSADTDDEEEASSFLRPGIQRAVLRRLRTGQIPIEQELDLHGCTAAEAESRVRAFLHAAQTPGRQCAVRLIHGKGLGSDQGKPVLKGKTADLLRKSAAVLAFCSALPSNGGSGAVHVLLKRR
jgi:DNA-nicking Smr family endonuclease